MHRLKQVRWFAGSPFTARRLWVFVVGLVVALVTWPVQSIVPTYGLDPSWGAALHLAAHDRMAFGPDLVFTYGPLGFLTVPVLYFTPTAMLAFAFVALAHLTLAVTLIHAAAKATRPWLAVVLVMCALLVLPPTAPASLLAVAALVFAILDLAAERPSRRLLPALIGMAAGLEVLVKFNDGLAILAIGLVVVVGNSRHYGWKPAALFAAATSTMFTALWLASGNHIQDVLAFIGGSMQVATGYSMAMGLETPGREWEYGAAALVLALLMQVAWRSAESWRRDARLALLVLLSVMAVLGFKHGFVRHDGHSIGFFAVVLAMLVPLVRLPARAGLAAIGAAVLALVWTAGGPPLDLVNPIPRLEALTKQVVILGSEDARASLIHRAQARMQEHYSFDAETIRLIRSGSVHVEPDEVGVVWAYYPTIEWDPNPVFQTYSAYTAPLDNANARHLSGGRGPDWILREADKPIDRRNGDFESPAATLALICHYREAHVDSGGTWQVLQRVGNRCGKARRLATATVRLGAWVDVPRAGPNQLVYARIHGVRSGIAEFLRAMMYKSEAVNIGERGRGTWRLVIGTAEDSLLLVAPASVGYSGVFAYPRTQDAIRIEYPGPGSADDAVFRVDFFVVPLDP